MPSVYARCPTCNEQIPGPTQAQANRNLGLHRRSKHGYRSPVYEEARQYRLKAKVKQPLSPERLEQLKAAREARWEGHTKLSVAETRRQWRARQRETLDKPKPASEWTEQKREYQKQWREKRKAEMAALAKNNTPDSAVPCNLAACPVCGSRFYVVRGQQNG